MEQTIRLTVNGSAMERKVNPAGSLLWFLRTELDLTGTKYGCGEGHCGACTILVDGEAVRSCTVTLEEVAGKSVITIEGLADGDKLHPVQEAFVENDALQCGYCTPGMILTAVSLLRKNPKPSRAEILSGMNDNFCRCGAHTRIVDAIEQAAHTMAQGGD